MTEKQQIIYIKYIRALVSQAIQKTTALMPEGAERPAHRRGAYIGCFGIGVPCTPELFPDHYTAGVTEIPALVPFDDVLAMLDNDIEILSKPTQEQGK